jgi:glutathione S-transferase
MVPNVDGRTLRILRRNSTLILRKPFEDDRNTKHRKKDIGGSAHKIQMPFCPLSKLYFVICSFLISNNVVATFTMASSKNVIKLTYFDIEGVAEAVRLALVLSNTPYDDIRIPFSDWPALKESTPNGQLPTMTIGDDKSNVKTQSKAMLRWIGMTKSSTLYPVEKIFDIEEAIGDIEDLQRAFTPAQYMGMRPTNFGYPDGFQSTEEGKKLVESLRAKFITDELPKFIQRLEKKLSQHGGPYLVAGSEPTIADCVAIPALRAFTAGFMDHVDPKCLEKYPTIITYIQNFCAAEGIKGRYTNGVH